MRDILLLLILAPGCLITLRFPFVGAMLWTWISIMSPHRLAFGFMLDAPLAQLIALCILIGMLASKEKRSPFIGAPVTWLVVFVLWMCLTTALALYPEPSFVQLQKILKIDLMVLVSAMLIRTRREMLVFTWVMTLSLAFYGIKGGIFTLLTGGGSRVYGPSGTYVEENNALAAALVLVVPLIRFLQTTLTNARLRLAMTGAMLLCCVSILGSHSRGALLAVSSMLAVMWWRGRSKVITAALVLSCGAAALSFMPAEWWARMHTIETYEEDRSAMGRIHAWSMAINLAKDRLVGGGFSIWNAPTYATYQPDAPLVVSAHSIYFHIIGEHGFIGMFIYLGMWMATWLSAGWLRKHAGKQPETRMFANLGAMAQVSLIGFSVGGAFLSLAYYDLPYNLLVLVAAARVWVQSGAWRDEPPYQVSARFLGIPLFFGDRLFDVKPIIDAPDS